MGGIYQVTIPNTFRDGFDYLGGEFSPLLGARVWVPFRQGKKMGIITGIKENPATDRPLKTLLEVVDEIPLLAVEDLELCEWISQYYQSPLSEVLALALPKRLREGKPMKMRKSPPLPGTLAAPLVLHEEQALAKTAICENLHHYQCFLLQGVTGSGKTEVYLQVMAEVLQQGKQILVLVPEIGLTPQLVDRFRQRIAEPIAVIHSHLNDSERQLAWQLAQQNEVRVIIGTRAAVFTPMPQLGLIVIDEEHDASFKQMDGVRYSARDTALVRAHKANIPIILGSATPCLESLYNVQQNKYRGLALTRKAASLSSLHYQIIDLRQKALQNGLAEPALRAIEQHLQAGNQVLVFINRRGFSPVLLCHGCGWMVDCRACDSHLTLHRQSNRLICHHCGLSQLIPKQCPQCKGLELIPVGTGTQRLEEFLQSHFSDYPVLRIDRDEVRKKHQFEEQIAKILSGQAQLIVGTQMLAKGHHFPKLSLVVVVDADSGFYNQDFRALERLGQLLVQVSGRAGREDIPGDVLIQTHLPQHPLLNTLIQQGYQAFAETLMELRQQSELPPYHYMAVLRAQSRSASRVLELLKASKDQILLPGLAVWGPAPAPLAKKAHEHRMQLLLKSPHRALLKQALSQLRIWLSENKLANNIKWNVDVDPQDLS